MKIENHAKFRTGSQLLVISLCALVMAVVSLKAKAESVLNRSESDSESVGTPVEKEWTFLLFLNGHNNLDSFGSMNINSMEEVGSSDKVNFVVQWASLANQDTQRLYITKDSDKSKVTSPVIEKMPAVDMGDYKELVKFIEWGVKKYPAKKYFVAVWNHGSGWHRIKQDIYRDISYDENTGNHITTEQLGTALKEASQIIGKKIELYASDACLMAMAEVAGEMKDSVSFFAGSQDLEPGEGWPYSTFMKRWVANPLIDGAELGKILTEEYVKSYNGGIYGFKNVTFSAFDLSKYPSLAIAIGNLSTTISKLSANEITTLKKAVSGTQEFYYSDYKDLSDFVTQLKGQNLSINSSVLTDVSSSAANFIIANGATGNFSPKSKGLAIWIPEYSSDMSTYGLRYEKLQFNQDTNWLSALKNIIK